MNKDDVRGRLAVSAVNGGDVEAALLLLDGARLQPLGLYRGVEGEGLRVLLPPLLVGDVLLVGLEATLLLLLSRGPRLPQPVSFVELAMAATLRGH